MGVTLEDTKNTVGLNRKGGVSSSDSDSVALGEWVGVNLHDTWQVLIENIRPTVCIMCLGKRNGNKPLTLDDVIKLHCDNDVLCNCIVVYA